MGEFLIKCIRFYCFATFAFGCISTVGASTCPTGYATLDAEKHIDTTYNTFSEATFMSPEDGLCQSGFTLIDIPSDVIPIFNGFLQGSAITLCEDGYKPNNGTCVSYAQGSCETDYQDIALNMASFMDVENGLCKNGFSLKEMPFDLVPIYNGFLLGSKVTLCSNGFLVNNSSCSTYSAGDCPQDYQDLSLDTNTLTTLTNGSCGTGYTRFAINQQCNANTNDAICGILCSDNLEYTDIGTCAELCSGEYTTLRTSTGLIFPMYATKQITPSINIGIGNNVCYVNLVPGQADNAINIRYDNQTYHTVK